MPLSRRSADWTTGQVRAARHKICFLVTFADGLVTAFWLGRQPQTFWLNYALKMVLLLFARYLCWKPLRQHYYMCDFCYFANIVTLSYVFVCPQSAFLFNAASGFCGFTLLSSLLFRDSYVLHSIDFFTTMQLHLLPALTMWTIRWYEYLDDPTWHQHTRKWAPYYLQPPKETSIIPAGMLYLAWFISYSLYMFVFARQRIQRNQYKNLYDYVMGSGLGLKKKVSHVLPWVNVYPYGEIAFMCGHASLFGIALLYTQCNFFLQSLFLSVSILKGIYHGGTYYIDHFWKCYEANAAWYLEESKLPSLEKRSREKPRRSNAKKSGDSIQGRNPQDGLRSAGSTRGREVAWDILMK